MGSGKKRERDSTGGSSGAKEEGETQSLKKAKIEDSTSASVPQVSCNPCPLPVEEEWVRQQRETREKMQLLVSAFSNSQQDQYEVFRRSSFPKSSVKRIMQV